MILHRGRIARITKSGMGYIETSEYPGQLPFLFLKIRGYRGEFAGQLKQFSRQGLVEGIDVEFTLNMDNTIREVFPAE